MPVTGIKGAMYDPDSTQALGMMSTGIGGGLNAVYSPPIDASNPVVGNGVSIARIGSPPPYGAKAKSWEYPAAVVTFQTATAGAVADGGLYPDGSTNRSGQTCPANGGGYATK